MPSSYAHFQFGVQAIPALPADIRRPIQRYRRLFDLGLQGPDFFYFYKFYSSTSGASVRQLAGDYHYRPGREVFEKFCRDLGHPTEAELAYLYGMVGHYCLDSACHPLIHEAARREDGRHNAIESEFDRYLMEQNGIPKPHGYNRGIHLKCSKSCVPVIARFYPEAEEKQIREGMDTMELILRLLTLHTAAELVLKVMGGSYPGLLMDKIADPEKAPLNGQLQGLFDGALARYPDCLQQLHSHMAFGEPFGKDFEPIFG